MPPSPRGTSSSDDEIFHDAEEGFSDSPLATACGPPLSVSPAEAASSGGPQTGGSDDLWGFAGDEPSDGGRVWGSLGTTSSALGDSAWERPGPPAPALSAAEAWERGWDEASACLWDETLAFAPQAAATLGSRTSLEQRSRPGSRLERGRSSDPFAGSAFDPLSASIFEPRPESAGGDHPVASALTNAGTLGPPAALSPAPPSLVEPSTTTDAPRPRLLEPLLAPMPEPFFPDSFGPGSVFALGVDRDDAPDRQGISPGPLGALPAMTASPADFAPAPLAPTSEFPLFIPSPSASPPPLPPAPRSDPGTPDEGEDPWHRAALETRAHVIGRLLRLIAIMSDLEDEIPYEDFSHARRAVLLILGVIHAAEMRYRLHQPEWAPLSGRRPARRGASRRPPIALIPKDVAPDAAGTTNGKHSGHVERKGDEPKRRAPKERRHT